MLKILRTTLRQPCGLAKRKMVLRLPQEIPQKCVRRQVHGCRRADVKRALHVRMEKIHSKMKALEWSQHFSHYNSMRSFQDAQGQLTPQSMVGLC